ncbi:ATP-binding protein [Candidatus Gracilibacteria bacterium]|nr:ATP-binding protein [Candidatus Gracilibacteria bacterium]
MFTTIAKRVRSRIREDGPFYDSETEGGTRALLGFHPSSFIPMLNIATIRARLQSFDLRGLFVEELGWNRPPRGVLAGQRTLPPATLAAQVPSFTLTPIAELAGVVVFEVTVAGGAIPDEELRRAIQAEVAQYHLEHLLIFLDAERSSSLWYWVKRDGSKRYPRRHTYVQGQPGDLLISKLSAMFVDMSDLDAKGELRLTEAIAASAVRSMSSPSRRAFSTISNSCTGHCWRRSTGSAMSATGAGTPRCCGTGGCSSTSCSSAAFSMAGTTAICRIAWRIISAGVLARSMPSCKRSSSRVLRSPKGHAARRCNATRHHRYLNGGLFLQHAVEQRYATVAVPDSVFSRIFALFERYDWALDDSPTGNEREINPAVLGYIFEKYINQKAFGAYYTRNEITEYLCEQTIHRLVLDQVNETLPSGATPFTSVGDLLLKPTAAICRSVLMRILPNLRLIDPACGSGAFLVAAMRTLISIYSGLLGHAKTLGDSVLDGWLRGIERDHPNLGYYIKKQIIVNNLYGVDIMAEAVEIARLRLFLALVAAANRVEDLEPLPNIDFNILAGNALIGLLRVDEAKAEAKRQAQHVAQLGLFDEGKRESYRQVVAEKNRLVASYRHAADTLRAEDLSALRDEIQRQRAVAADLLDAMLLDDFGELRIRYEEATWDAAKGKEGKPKRRPLTIEDIRALQPFHWGYEFDEVMNERGGFDAIIANPPWEVWQTDEKEFFVEHESTIRKKKLRLEDWKQQQTVLMRDSVLREAWLEYVSRFPHVSAYLKKAPHFANQLTVMDGKNIGSKINLYTYFVEQCFNLLRSGGQCGIVVPSGIYTDMGTAQLRKLLFYEAQVRSLLSVSNERYLFEGVHHSFKYVFLTFEKGGTTDSFHAAFRINPREAVGQEEIDAFLNMPSQHLLVGLDTVQRLSPTLLSVMEFRSATDIRIAEKMLQYPLLGQLVPGTWRCILTNEFNITSDGALFQTLPAPARLPLFTGKMFNQYTLTSEHSGYWIDEQAGRKALLGKLPDTGQVMDYQGYRFVHRRIARNTDSRTFIATIAPRNVFSEVNSTVLDVTASGITLAEQLYLCAVCNSLTLDWMLRQKVAATLNMFYIYQLPVPRLTASDARFAPIVERAAKLICTTPEYDALAAEVGLDDHSAGVTDPTERNKLRAELDGLVAHLYGLSEEELTHILGTFPLVAQAQKAAVLTAYRAYAPNPDDAQVAALIAAGESDRVEFKVAAYWNAKTGKKDVGMRDNIVQAVAAFLNSAEGGVVLIGVENATNRIVGLRDDYAAANDQKRDRDGYELALRDAIGSMLGQTVGTLLTFAFHIIDGADICRISVRPAPAPVYLNGDLYVRIGNAKKKLSAQQAVGYIAQRWR